MNRGILACIAAIALMLAAIACGYGVDENAPGDPTIEQSSTDVVPETGSSQESLLTCTPPLVLCPCYDDGRDRCVGRGVCAKCCAGEIPACDETNP